MAALPRQIRLLSVVAFLLADDASRAAWSCGCERGEGLAEEAADPARPIGDQEQGAERSQTQQHGDVQALEEGCAHATQVARAVLGHDPRRAQFQKMPGFRLAREHFVHRQQHLFGSSSGPRWRRSSTGRVASARRAASTRSQSAHDTPSGGRTCSRARAASTAAFSSAGHPARRRGWPCGTRVRSKLARSSRVARRRPRPARPAG